MSNLVQCMRCKQIVIREEQEGHVCDPPFREIRNIEVLQWWETKNEKGERQFFGLGVDGCTYTMTEMKEGFIEIDPKNRNTMSNKRLHDEDQNEEVKESDSTSLDVTGKKSDEDVNSTLYRSLYIVQEG